MCVRGSCVSPPSSFSPSLLPPRIVQREKNNSLRLGVVLERIERARMEQEAKEAEEAKSKNSLWGGSSKAKAKDAGKEKKEKSTFTSLFQWGGGGMGGKDTMSGPGMGEAGKDYDEEKGDDTVEEGAASVAIPDGLNL